MVFPGLFSVGDVCPQFKFDIGRFVYHDVLSFIWHRMSRIVSGCRYINVSIPPTIIREKVTETRGVVCVHASLSSSLAPTNTNATRRFRLDIHGCTL